MALVIDGSGDITGLVAGALESTSIGTGSVRQVVANTRITEAGSGTVDILFATITPSSSSSKILIIADTQAYVPSGAIAALDTYRGSTFICRSSCGVGWGVYANQGKGTSVFLDSPSTTSPVTYKIQGLHVSGGAPYFGSYRESGYAGTSNLILIEIAG